ncbi:HupE/UreJ family protein [Spongiibacter sp. KMU-158]|uniref:HupE/UreJ family protein n=1 Tax=Spongiibacter pelagi TaxID=2760804 RepID=A0A927C2W1_9GAMM|nr:HupE/UreJ family protein [Spongiibacter pelagi]MBD2859779.1 HupE/UreJ family protein [Spongiibacter pelagi]
MKLKNFRLLRFSAIKIALLFLGILLCSNLSYAHKLAPSLLEITETQHHKYQVLWRTPANAAVQPKPVFPLDCQLNEPDLTAVGTAMEWRWLLSCDKGLAGETLRIEDLIASRTAALVRYTSLNFPEKQSLLTADNTTYQFPVTAESERLVMQYAELGVEHILIGIDHLFFVAGLLLLAGNVKTLLKTVTAFTVGHSITLALVSLNILPQWSALIEFGIAVTILILAVELSVHKAQQASFLQRYQWPVAACFGLIHGLGFAGVLSELGLPKNDILPALLSFNIGIEIGQLLFVASLALILFVLNRLSTGFYKYARLLIIYAMGSVSVYWCLDRGISLAAELM